jgi:hypothetical protein
LSCEAIDVSSVLANFRFILIYSKHKIEQFCLDFGY